MLAKATLYRADINLYCYEFVNIACKICKCYLFLYYNISGALKIFIFWGKNCVILAKFQHEISILLLCCKLNTWRNIFGDNLAKLSDLATFLAKNECSRNFKF